MRVIEVFADVRCPFAHVGLHRIVAERERRGVDVPLRVRAWPLELVNGVPMDPVLIGVEVRALHEQVAPDLFAGFDQAQWPSTSMPALALTASAYAISDHVGEQVALRLRHALFEEGRDIARRDALQDVAGSVGMEMPLAADFDQVHEDWDDGRRRGVIGSPHFFVGNESWFCPALDIHHDRGRLRIVDDGAGLTDFVRHALAS